MNKNSFDVKGCKMYVALFPCNECAKLIIQSGIKEIIYVSDKHHQKDEMKASRRLLDMAGVEYRWIAICTDANMIHIIFITCRQFIPNRQVISVDFSSIDKSSYPG